MPLPDLTFLTQTPIALALSGGRDSMALAHMLQKAGATVHAITVDHGMRAESADEAAQVGRWMNEWGLPHTILTWEGNKPQTGLMDAARDARYRLMAKFCKENGWDRLAVAHHADDQIETFLHRLTKGSGLDGLSGMQEKTSLYGITLIRPLLSMTRDEVTSYCQEHVIPYVDDPSNEKDAYTRVRFRKFLQSEGLDTAAMQRTIHRLSRVSILLEEETNRLYQTLVSSKSPLTMDHDAYNKQPEEYQIRLLLKALQQVSGDFRPTRLSKIEEALPVIAALSNGQSFTLGGCLITRKAGVLIFQTEKRKT